VVEKAPTSPDVHIASLPDSVRGDVAELDTAIAEAMGDEARVLWTGVFWGGSEQTIIGYGDYTYRRPKGKDVEWFIVGLAVQKKYLSVYVNAVEDGRYLAEQYAAQLGKVKVGKSSIGFRRLADLNLDVLLELVRKARQVMRQ
jgi:hypothetical protein